MKTIKIRLSAFIVSVITVVSFFTGCSSEALPPDNTNLKENICRIPAEAEELRKSAAELRRYDDLCATLSDRTEEEVGTYVSEDCAILIRKVTFAAEKYVYEGKTADPDAGKDVLTLHVADVYIHNMSQFIGYVCRDEKDKLTKKPASDVLDDTNAVLLINSDFLTARNWGLYVRGGRVIRKKTASGIDLCAIGKDGKMQIFDKDGFDVDKLLGDDNLYHVFSFGPSLLNADGTPRDEDAQFHITEQYSKWNNYVSTVGFPVPNPRTAIGQAKDGHFIFVTVDGRLKGHSRGATFPELSHILYEEGAVTAYNMDGGGSEIMVFEGAELTKLYEDGRRTPSDYICITSSGYSGRKDGQTEN